MISKATISLSEKLYKIVSFEFSRLDNKSLKIRIPFPKSPTWKWILIIETPDAFKHKSEALMAEILFLNSQIIKEDIFIDLSGELILPITPSCIFRMGKADMFFSFK